MHLIASHPINESALSSYYGKPVTAVTHHGDTFVGTLDSIKDGYAYFSPVQPGAANVSSLKQSAFGHPKVKAMTKGKKGKKLVYTRSNAKKAKTNAFLGGYPYYGYGAGYGWSIALPLFVLLALFTTPFFF